MPPAGQRRELEAIGNSKVGVGCLFAAVVSGALPGAVVPDTERVFAAGERGRTVGAGPVDGAGYQSFLDAACEEVAQPSHLSELLFGDEDGLVAALQQRAAPAVEPTGLFRQLCIEQAHEGGELVSVGGGAEQVEVVGEADEGVDLDVVALGGASEDADEDLAYSGVGPEQEATL
jgi:hypothetical protein